MSTFGPAYSKHLDGGRLDKQRDTIRDYMIAREWRTLSELSHVLGYPEASISAQLRHLRKQRFGGFTVDKRRSDAYPGLWEYRVSAGVS